MTALPSSEWRRTLYVVFVATTAAMITFLFGYKAAVMSVAITYMTEQFHMSPAAQGFVMTCPFFGCLLGPSIGGWLCDRIGREKTLLMALVITSIASLMNAIAMNITLGGAHISSLTVFNIFHILDGFAAGLGSIATPMYIAEIAPPRIRGKLVMIYQMAVVTGAAVAPFICYPLSLHLPAETSWRWMFASALPISVVLLVCVAALPPSPRWLAELGRFDAARNILERFHGPELARRELAEIESSLHSEKEDGEWRELLQRGVRLALFIGLCLAFFNSWTGSATGGYVGLLIEQAGEKDHSVTIMRVGMLNSFMVAITIVSMALIDRAGRRPLWITGSALMIVATFCIGLAFQLHLSSTTTFVVLCLATLPHALALGGIPWVMMPELFPNRIRAKAVSITTTFLVLTGYLGGQLFPVFESISTRTIGTVAGAFWVFTFMCVLSLIFGLTILPETRGRTLEAIADSFEKREGNQTRT